MGSRYAGAAALAMTVILVVGCGPTGPAATSALPRATPVATAPAAPSTQTPVPPAATEMAPPALPPLEGGGGGVIAYCYQPMTGNSLHQIYTIRVDGSDNRRLIQASIGLNHQDWSPGARTIAAVGYADPSTWSIYIFDVDGGELTRLTNTPGVLDSEPSWSPDGTRIAFTRTYPDQDEREEIWVMDAGGSDPHWIGVEGFAAKWSPDGSRFIYTSDRSGNYEIYTANIDGTGERQLASTSADESFPTWSPDGSQVAYSASTGEWNTRENSQTYEVYVMDADGTSVRQLTQNAAYDGNPRWSPDGSLLVFSSDRAAAGHWEIYVMNADGSNVRQVTNTPARATAINPVWRPSATAITPDTVAGVECLRTLEGHSRPPYGLAFSPDGRFFGSAGLDGVVLLWDRASWQVIREFKASRVWGWRLSFLADSAHISSGNGTVWDIDSGETGQAPSGDRHVAFSPDGVWMAANGRGQATIELWRVVDWQLEREIATDHAGGIFAMAFSPDSRLIASADNVSPESAQFSVKLWDVPTGRELSAFHGHQDAIHGLAFSPDGRWLASASMDTTVKVWDVQTGQLAQTLQTRAELFDVAFSPDSSLVAAALNNRTVELWDVASGRLVRTLDHGGEVVSVAFSPDGSLLASGAYDNRIYLWGIPR